MFKILVVDDDKIIRKGLIKIIEKSDTEFEIAGEAANGLRALEVIKESKPDILITDIKMPVMDGIELINRIQEEKLDLSIVVLSGFDDYKYVREALKGGAYDYLLKPIDKTQMFDILYKLKEKIISKEKKQEEIKYISKLVSDSEKIMKEKSFISILDGSKNDLDLLETKDSRNNYIVVFSIDGLYKHEENNNAVIMLENLKKEVYEVFKDGMVIAAEMNKKIVMLFNFLNTTSDYFNKALENIILKCHDNEKVTIGVSRIFNDKANIQNAYDEAVKAVEFKFYYGTNKIYHYEENNNILKGNINLEEIKSLEDSLINYIQICDLEKIKLACKKIFEYLNRFKVEPAAVKKMLNAFISKMSSKEQDFLYVVENNEEGDVDFFIENIDTYFELCDYVIDYLLKAAEKMKLIRSERDKKIIERAKLYIKKHYKEDITLKTVADYVFLNPNYFSKLFKEEVHINFIDYLIETRIEVAKELLKVPGIKVYEVAEQIGYDEVVSFNRAFKKVVGVSPKNYLKLIN